MKLQEAVTASRKQYATEQRGDSVQSMITFNHELLLYFQQRHSRTNGQTSKEKQPTPKHAMYIQNTCDNFSDDDDDIEDSASVARDSMFGSSVASTSNKAALLTSFNKCPA